MELLTIGAFAKASRLSPKALRLYDELGLLTPARVDPDTGYRRYAPEQLEQGLRLLSYSPEPRVIEKVLEAASLTGRVDLALAVAQRYRVVFPDEYRAWQERQAPLR